MAEYLDRKQVLDLFVHSQPMADAYKTIALIPAADVRPVVLCKECKYRNTDKYGSWCLNDYEHNLKDDDFCSRGKRK